MAIYRNAQRDLSDILTKIRFWILVLFLIDDAK